MMQSSDISKVVIKKDGGVEVVYPSVEAEARVSDYLQARGGRIDEDRVKIVVLSFILSFEFVARNNRGAIEIAPLPFENRKSLVNKGLLFEDGGGVARIMEEKLSDTGWERVVYPLSLALRKAIRDGKINFHRAINVVEVMKSTALGAEGACSICIP